jgi:hypothetical protein
LTRPRQPRSCGRSPTGADADQSRHTLVPRGTWFRRGGVALSGPSFTTLGPSRREEAPLPRAIPHSSTTAPARRTSRV